MAECNLPAKFLFNLHLGDNVDEDWMRRLMVEVSRVYGNEQRQYDAAAFLELMAQKLELPEELFKSLRQVYEKCLGPKCQKLPVSSTRDDDRICKS